MGAGKPGDWPKGALLAHRKAQADAIVLEVTMIHQQQGRL